MSFLKTLATLQTKASSSPSICLPINPPEGYPHVNGTAQILLREYFILRLRWYRTTGFSDRKTIFYTCTELFQKYVSFETRLVFRWGIETFSE